MSDPKEAAGKRKVDFTCLPWNVVSVLAAVMSAEGAAKYGQLNWRDGHKVNASTYFNGALRHLLAWYGGENTDKDCGANVSHVIKAISSLLVLADAEMLGVLEDDRPIPATPNHIEEANALYNQLSTVHGDRGVINPPRGYGNSSSST